MHASPNGTPSRSPVQKSFNWDSSNPRAKSSSPASFVRRNYDRLDFSPRVVTLIGMSIVRKYRLIAGTGLVVMAIRLALRMVSLPRLLNWLTSKAAAEGHDRIVMEDVAYYVERWLALAPYNPKGNCFPRALTLYWFARRAGFPVQFLCGVMKLNANLEGHAWLMLDGRAFFEPSPHWRSFTVTVSFPQVPVPLDHQPSDSP